MNDYVSFTNCLIFIFFKYTELVTEFRKQYNLIYLRNLQTVQKKIHLQLVFSFIYKKLWTLLIMTS